MRHLFYSILVTLFFGFSSSTIAQTLVVDGSGSTPGAYKSISAAIATVTGPGAVIEIVGLVDPASGMPTGYSDNPFFPTTTQSAEIFPILVPPGVTLRRLGSAPVYIWSAAAGSPPNLFEVQSSPMALVQPVKFVDLNIIGGAIAISASLSTVGTRADVSILGCWFSRNKMAAQAKSVDGSLVRMEVEKCTLTDGQIATPGVQPAYQDQEIGFQFEAKGSSGTTPSSTVGSITELSVTGTFDNMNPVSSNNSLAGRGASTRVVDVFSAGSDLVHFPGVSLGDYKPYPIPEVKIDVMGGDWSGNAGGIGDGWGEAIRAEAVGASTSNPFNYYCGYRINVTGTQMVSFGEDGIFCGSFMNSRGHLSMNGQALVEGTGEGSSISETEHSGVFVYSHRSYMGFTATACTFQKNLGNGVYLKNDGDRAANTDLFNFEVPTGIFLGLLKAKINANHANGVFLQNLRGLASGFIGGTIHQVDDSSGFFPFSIGDAGHYFLYMDDSPLYNGQGVINRCDISVNDFAGVKVRADGESGVDPEEASSAPSGVAFRLSNNFIWSNPHGGLNVNWGDGGAPSASKGDILLPVTHTTMAYNGDGSHDYTMEIDDRNGAAVYQRAIYEWQDPGLPTVAQFYRTNVWNTTLIRTPGSGVNSDLGPVLDLNPGSSIPISSSSTVPSPHQIGFAGVRATSSWFPLVSLQNDRNTNDVAIPFVGPLPPVAPGSAAFKLTNTGTDNIINWTPTYFHVFAPRTFIDHGGQSRPGETSGLRDKGADEVD